MPDEKEPTSQGSSLNLDAILRVTEHPFEPIAPQNPRQHMPSRHPSRFDVSKIRNGVSDFYNKRKDNPALNVVVDILMVVFGLGATAGFLALIVLIVRLFSGTI